MLLTRPRRLSYLHATGYLLDSVNAIQDLVDPTQYLQLFPAAFAPKKSQFDLAGISTVYSTVDFIGISAYPSLTPNFTLNQIESATQQFDLEAQNFGINLKDLLFRQVGSSICWSALNHHV